MNSNEAGCGFTDHDRFPVAVSIVIKRIFGIQMFDTEEVDPPPIDDIVPGVEFMIIGVALLGPAPDRGKGDVLFAEEIDHIAPGGDERFGLVPIPRTVEFITDS